MSVVPLVAHRCQDHVGVEPMNADATTLTLYQDGRAPGCKDLSGVKAECGGCLGEQVDAAYHQFLDMLDVVADLLRAHAEMRVRHEVPSTLVLPPGAKL